MLSSLVILELIYSQKFQISKILFSQNVHIPKFYIFSNCIKVIPLMQKNPSFYENKRNCWKLHKILLAIKEIPAQRHVPSWAITNGVRTSPAPASTINWHRQASTCWKLTNLTPDYEDLIYRLMWFIDEIVGFAIEPTLILN